MIEIKVELDVDDAVKECLKNGVDTHGMGKVSINMEGTRGIVTNELGIALFEIFERDPEILTKAMDYATNQIEKHHKEEE